MQKQLVKGISLAGRNWISLVSAHRNCADRGDSGASLQTFAARFPSLSPLRNVDSRYREWTSRRRRLRLWWWRVQWVRRKGLSRIVPCRIFKKREGLLSAARNNGRGSI